MLGYQLFYSRGQQTIFGSLPFFINKVLLALSQSYLFMYYLWLLLCYSNQVEWLQQTIWPTKPNIFTIWAFTEKNLPISVQGIGFLFSTFRSTIWFPLFSKYLTSFQVLLLPPLVNSLNFQYFVVIIALLGLLNAIGYGVTYGTDIRQTLAAPGLHPCQLSTS